MSRVYIVAAKRTPIGRFRGTFAGHGPVELATVAAQATLDSVSCREVDQVILGNVLSAGHGMNIARQLAINIGLPIVTPAFTINMMCGSGLQTALLGAQAIRSGDAGVVLVGGVESMSQAAMLVQRPAKGQSISTDSVVDSMQRDGLVDSFSHRHMAETAEDLASEFQISRAEQDAWAARSQQLYATALKNGHYADEIVAVGDISADEHPRPDVNQTSLGTLKPIFDSNGTVTAGNSSGINDGAAMILLASESAVEKNGWTVMAEWQDATVVGCDPQRMGLGPVHAIQKLLDRTRLTLQGIDTLEINEAFAAQTLACIKRLEITLPSSQPDATTGLIGQHSLQLNPHGGAIAIGHPLAASGARLLTHLAWQIARNHSTRAIASLCIGGGMGIAALLTAPGPMD